MVVFENNQFHIQNITPVCLIDEQGLISAQGVEYIKKLINAQGLIIIIL